MKSINIVIGILAALALAGGGFAAGTTYEHSQVPAATAVSGGATGARGSSGGTRVGLSGPGGAAAGQQPVIGRVIAVNDGSITVAAVDRSQSAQAGASPATTTQIVLVGASTRLVKTAETEVKLSEIKPNDQVTIVGTTDSTGMVAATAIVVGPTNILGQLFGSQTGTPGGRPSPTPTKAP